MSDLALFTEKNEVLAKIDPASYGTAQNTGWASLSTHGRAVAVMQVGLIAATGTLDFKLQQAKDSGGTGAKDIPGKAITQLADAADNVVRVIEIKTDEMDVSGGFTHIRAVATPATAASLLSVVILGCAPAYEPVSQPAYVAVTN
ncbi:MAG: hypothetical protein MUE40_21965 [Anaerolineae bacterium]|nr:hypothetical protein [Anaerolineae bacterium]